LEVGAIANHSDICLLLEPVITERF